MNEQKKELWEEGQEFVQSLIDGNILCPVCNESITEEQLNDCRLMTYTQQVTPGKFFSELEAIVIHCTEECNTNNEKVQLLMNDPGIKKHFLNKDK